MQNVQQLMPVYVNCLLNTGNTYEILSVSEPVP